MKNRYITVISVIALLVSGCSAENTAPGQAETADKTVQSEIPPITGTDIVISPMDGVASKDNIYTIKNGGSYTLSGSLADGQVVIDSDEDVELVLNGARIYNSNGPAIYAKNGDVKIILSENSENDLWDGASYDVSGDENNPNSVIFTQDDLTITGNGVLNVKGSYKNAINCKDKLIIEKEK